MYNEYKKYVSRKVLSTFVIFANFEIFDWENNSRKKEEIRFIMYRFANTTLT